jgi:hypothetical protein
MSNFTKAETRERRFIEWWIGNHTECTLIETSEVGSFGRNDFKFRKNDNEFIAEVKIRTFIYDKYDTIVIEMDKVNHLLKEAVKTKARVLYFAVYPESRCYFVIDVMSIPSTISYEYCPRTTVEDRGMTDKVMLNYRLTDCEPYKISF